MGTHLAATGLANLEVHDHADAIARLDLLAIILAGILVILAAWDWFKRRT